LNTSVHVFIYGAPNAGIEAEAMQEGAVAGTLFEVDGVGPALMLAGHSSVRGMVLRVSAEALGALDGSAGVREGLFRRVGVKVGGIPCWTWVAGPAIAPRLAGSRRLRGGAA
jgi:hypothetical protein